MNTGIKLVFKRTFQISGFLILIILFMIQFDVMWLPPKIYHPKEQVTLHPPVMTLEEYTSSGLIDTHARPYIFMVESKQNNGAVLVFGAEHIKDPAHRQFLMMEEKWNSFNPTVAMLEGRLGFLFSWTQDPIKEKGESGLTAKMAKSKRIKLYTWEPGREAEINYFLANYDTKHIASFFCLQIYQNRWSQFSKSEQDNIMGKMIFRRTRYDGLKGSITSVEQVDSIWKADYPTEVSWRSYKHPENGWPEGKFKQIAEQSSYLRDEHTCRSIIELVNKGERVFISVGASHAACIEKTLRGMIK